ncbi:hypothetical protein IACHDJAJ_00037 [Aeromonas phage vB_AdhS_TS3]|nr:hypothetical protein IACHDJAJ_00037 [Aeromonas phage vB_AdhS_TS3]
MQEHSKSNTQAPNLNTVSSFRLMAKSEWLGTIDYNGEECELFVQNTLFPQVFVVSSSDMKLQCIPLKFHTSIIRRD